MRHTNNKIFWPAVIGLALAVLAGCGKDNDGASSGAGGNAAGKAATDTAGGIPGIRFRYVPAGSFQRDSEAADVSVITKGYWMGETEVTQELFQAVMGDNPSQFTDRPGKRESQAKRPVERVSWYDAVAFCNKLSIKAKKQPVYSVLVNDEEIDWAKLEYGAIPTGNDPDWSAVTQDRAKDGYRLPTEMEWMWAAIGADKTARASTAGYQKTYAGSAESGDAGAADAAASAAANAAAAAANAAAYAWYSRNADSKTHEAGKKKANELGLFDMSGNVWEWVWDRFGGTAGPSGQIADGGEQTDYAGVSSGPDRVRRGGGWNNSAEYIAPASRSPDTPFSRYYYQGFRISRP